MFSCQCLNKISKNLQEIGESILIFWLLQAATGLKIFFCPYVLLHHWQIALDVENLVKRQEIDLERSDKNYIL